MIQSCNHINEQTDAQRNRLTETYVQADKRTDEEKDEQVEVTERRFEEGCIYGLKTDRHTDALVDDRKDGQTHGRTDIWSTDEHTERCTIGHKRDSC